jgi:predicted acylesterase/phospholipase RssA
VYARAGAFVLLMCLTSVPLPAQHALVLSGGGARGIAHAGALLGLEELGYEFPLIVGTSMGSIIGALHASGYEPAHIRRILADENWLARFAAEAIPIGPERAPQRPLLNLGLGPRRYHEGLVTGTGINLRLAELLFDAGVRARNDFDNLPRRFRAVAADFTTGAEVVIAGGDLPRAVRASMAVPGAFAPVPWAGTILVDGGIANNLPVSVARLESALPVVAVDAVRPDADAPERNPVDIGVRSLRLLLRNVQPHDADPDVLVVPRIRPGFSETRFPSDPERLIRAGYRAALEQAPHAPPATPASAPRAAGSAPLEVGDVRVEVGDPALARLIRSVMLPATGEYHAAEILRRISALYDTGLFTALWPRLDFDVSDGAAPALVIDAVPVTRSSVALGAHWDNDVGGGVWTSLRHRITAVTPLELRAGAMLDELLHRATFDASLFSARLPGLTWNAGAHAGEELIRTVDGASVNALRTRRAGGWFGAERQGNWFFSLMLRSDHLTADGDAPGSTGWATGPYLRISRVREPDVIVGVSPILEAETRTGAAPYSRANARGGITVTVGSIPVAAFADVAWSTTATPRDLMPAARRHLVPWLPAGALRAHHRAAVGADAAVPFILDGFVRVRLRALSALERIRWLDDVDNWRVGGELGFVWPTVVGPLEAGFAAGRGGHRFNVSIGTPF